MPSTGAAASLRWASASGGRAIGARAIGAAGSRAVIDWAVGYLGLRRLEAWIVASNGASLGLFRNLGFVEEGRLTQRYLVGGQYMDMLVLARITGV